MEYLYLELKTTGASPLYSRISEIKALRFDANKDSAGSHFERKVASLSEEKNALMDLAAFAAGCSNIAYPDEFSMAYIHDCLKQYGLRDFTVDLTGCEVSKEALESVFDTDMILANCETYTGELKHFYPDYKNYYYLPFEDCAVYKSVGESVDKSARIKATKETAYTKKAGTFIPAPKNSSVNLFKKSYDDADTYCLAEDATPQILLHLILIS